MKVMRSRRVLMALLLALALPVTLVACGDDEADNGGTDSQAQETPTETPTEAGAQTVHVVASEYQFEGVPDSLAAGSYEFHMMNEGKEPHEFILFRRLTDTPMEELFKMSDKELESEIEPMGGTFAKPGEDSEKPLEAELEAGDYAAVCFVSPKGGGPPHALRGMVHEFTVS